MTKTFFIALSEADMPSVWDQEDTLEAIKKAAIDEVEDEEEDLYLCKVIGKVTRTKANVELYKDK